MKIAITGTIGSGKTEVSIYLRNKGYFVFDCDAYNAYLLEKDNIGYFLVKEEFPECFINDELDKKKLADIIFNDEKRKKVLEDIMHPLILDAMNSYEDSDPFFCEVPLLFETNWDRYFDKSLLVIADEKDVLDRLINKGYDIESAKQRISSQMSVIEKSKRATQIIYNNGSLDDLHIMIDEWLKTIC